MRFVKADRMGVWEDVLRREWKFRSGWAGRSARGILRLEPSLEEEEEEEEGIEASGAV